MTLARQLLAGITAAFLALLIGIEAIYVSSARSHLEKQLDAHANETATSLALSLGSRVQSLDPSLLETMINPVFDRGYYALIEVRTTRGEIVMARKLASHESRVPAWFLALVPLEGPTGKALISAGWRQLGSVTVRMHPQFAYQQLWETAIATLAWLGALFALALLAVRRYLSGILRPLAEIEHAATAISNRDFVSISVLPDTRELRRVTDAMNSLSRKVREAIAEESARAEKLRREAFEDAVTGELNRRGFEQTASALIGQGGEVYEGALALFSLAGLEEVNRVFGLARGNAVLCTLAETLRAGIKDRRAVIGRWQGPTLAVLLVDTSAQAASAWAGERLAGWTAGLQTKGLPEGSSLRAGIAHFGGATTSFARLAADAEAALSAGPRQGDVTLVSGSGDRDASGLLREIESAIADGRISLLSQPALALAGGRVLHMELMSRLDSLDGTPIPAASFVPVASQFGLLPVLDRKAIGRAIEAMGRHPELPNDISLNVSRQSVSDPGFRLALRDLLQADPASARRLAFEMTGFSASRYPELCKEFSAELAHLGSRLALDNFELDRDALSLVHALRPAYIKIAPIFTREIGARRDVRFIVEAMLRMLQPLEIPLIAQGVEDMSMTKELADIGIAGFQGYASGRPKLLD
ncbi:MAG: EAL domain-containing protein [Betaproteobacteria bacterium]|nr:EAL domain-containing protein [Betaproteobacteria bacterium]